MKFTDHMENVTYFTIFNFLLKFLRRINSTHLGFQQHCFSLYLNPNGLRHHCTKIHHSLNHTRKTPQIKTAVVLKRGSSFCD